MNEAMNNLIIEDCKRSCKNSELFSILKGQTILVTGGTGFMGKWLAEMISYINDKEDYNIQLILLSRDIKKFEVEMPHLVEKPYIRLLRQDVRNVHDLPAEISYIIHAAGTPDNREHVSQPILTIETFYKGTQAILDAASRLPDLKKIVHISSHVVYGKGSFEDNISENFSGKLEISSINNVYAESKRIAETLCLAYRNQFKLPISIVRPFAFVGPYHDLEKPWAINNFIRDGLLGGSIRILGDGSTIRSYLYGSDMAYWILGVLINGKPGESYNVGSKEAISLNDLAIKIRELVNVDVDILSKSSKENFGSLSKLIPDTSKITKEIGLEETNSLDESIKRTVVWNQLIRK